MQKRVEREQMLAAEAAEKQRALLKATKQQVMPTPQQKPAPKTEAPPQVEVVEQFEENAFSELDPTNNSEYLTETFNYANNEVDNSFIDQQPLAEMQEEPMSNDSSSNEGYKKLAEYLNTAIKDKKSAGRVSGELQMALSMGMFSRDTLNEVLSQEFDTLVEILSSHESSLKSPKARILLKSVMDSLKK